MKVKTIKKITTVLGKDEKSEAFVRGYEDDLHDDAMDDFAHLAQDEMDVDENDENEPSETVDVSEVQAQLRLAARSNKGKERVSHLKNRCLIDLTASQQRFDPESVDWTEPANWSDDDEKYGVKDIEIPRKSAVGPRRDGLGQDGEMAVSDFLCCPAVRGLTPYNSASRGKANGMANNWRRGGKSRAIATSEQAAREAQSR